MNYLQTLAPQIARIEQASSALGFVVFYDMWGGFEERTNSRLSVHREHIERAFYFDQRVGGAEQVNRKREQCLSG